MRLLDSLPRLRRFLRDPDAAIWTDAQLLAYFNRGLVELALKTHVLERAEWIKWPARFTWTVTHEWEKSFAEGDVLTFPHWEAGDMSVTQAWETSPGSSSGDSGYFITQPWELGYGSANDVVPLKINSRWVKVMSLAFDGLAIQLQSLNGLAGRDPFYKTRIGRPNTAYWWDQTEGYLGLYPRPPVNLDTLADPPIFDDTGGVVTYTDEFTETSDTGFLTEEVDDADSLFIYYQPFVQIDDVLDEIEIPSWTVHVVESAVLEFAYGADTDGFIPSLRDYWRKRKENSYLFLNRLKTARLKDRTFVRGQSLKRRTSRHPTFPSGYPEVGP